MMAGNFWPRISISISVAELRHAASAGRPSRSPGSSSAKACRWWLRRSASPSQQDRIMRTRRRAFALHRKGTSRLAVPFSLLATSISRPMNFGFVQIDEKTEAGFDRIVLRRKIGAVQRITHLQAQRVARAQSAGTNAERLSLCRGLHSRSSRRPLRERKLPRRLRRCNRCARSSELHAVDNRSR